MERLLEKYGWTRETIAKIWSKPTPGHEPNREYYLEPVNLGSIWLLTWESHKSKKTVLQQLFTEKQAKAFIKSVGR